MPSENLTGTLFTEAFSEAVFKKKLPVFTQCAESKRHGRLDAFADRPSIKNDNMEILIACFPFNNNILLNETENR